MEQAEIDLIKERFDKLEKLLTIETVAGVREDGSYDIYVNNRLELIERQMRDQAKEIAALNAKLQLSSLRKDPLISTVYEPELTQVKE